MRKRFYIKFETGKPWSFDAGWYETIEQAEQYRREKGYSHIYSVRRYQSNIVDRTGFKPHFNHALGQWVDTKSQYNSLLKSKGYTEVGTEEFTPHSTKKQTEGLFDDGLVEHFRDLGHTLDDNLVDTLKKESKELGNKSINDVVKEAGGN